MNRTHENLSRAQKIKVGSNRNFGLVFGFVFFAVSVSPLLLGLYLRLLLMTLSVIFLALALLAPARLTLPNKYWTQLGFALGRIVSPVVLGILFFAVFLPTGLLLRLFKKDVLNLKWRKQNKSYWINSSSDISSMKDQF